MDDYTTSRSRDGPASFLQEFAGYLHADAFTGYDAIYLGSQSAIREVACWADARRKFFEAVKSYPREAHQVLEWIRQLYDIEDQARTWSADARRQLRTAEAIPVLDKIGVFLAGLAGPAAQERSGEGGHLRPKSMGSPASLHGRRPLDHRQQPERADVAAAGHRQKNWLFLGSENAGPRAAVLCTILAGESVIGSSRGPTCVNFFCACTRMIHNWKKCCPIAGRQPIPKPFSAAGSTNPEPGPLAPETVVLIVAPTPADPASGRRRPRTARTLT